MKKVKLKVPEKQAEKLADFVGSNQYVLLLSWSAKEGLFTENTYVYAWVAYPDTTEADNNVRANMKDFITA